VTRARCSTSKPRSPTAGGFPICVKNWKKRRNWERSSAQSRRNRRSMSYQGALARRRTRWTQSAGGISFGTRPADRWQDDQIGTG
jgi:hypothetical protein